MLHCWLTLVSKKYRVTPLLLVLLLSPSGRATVGMYSAEMTPVWVSKQNPASSQARRPGISHSRTGMRMQVCSVVAQPKYRTWTGDIHINTRLDPVRQMRVGLSLVWVQSTHRQSMPAPVQEPRGAMTAAEAWQGTLARWIATVAMLATWVAMVAYGGGPGESVDGTMSSSHSNTQQHYV